MADHDFPVIDLSPFFTTPGAGDDLGAAKRRQEVIRRIRGACTSAGIFLIVNHIMERTFGYFQKTAALIETLLNDALGLPPDLLHQYNSNRQSDRMIAYRYFKANHVETKKIMMIGSYPHKDPNLFTLLLQDDVGGLEFLRNDQWIPVTLLPHSLVVNVGDVLQVLSNNEFKSVTHRVVSPNEKDRYSCAFGCQIGRDKWVEPLPELTSLIKAAPKFKGFRHGEFLQLLVASYKPTLDPNDTFTLMDVVANHYALPTSKDLPDTTHQIEI
ncbi:unnamed protein product [Linum tenue]|uniref:Fe2OG dioxygenase domain-containing protein n=1 Tax=Linum tenue TaxID=586396 RepID=A0AAV0JT70_9ROSI|nr:unnamed protein product [Linum tenue]